jgi:hypothetical protein
LTKSLGRVKFQVLESEWSRLSQARRARIRGRIVREILA